jgi:hypothetical protein
MESVLSFTILWTSVWVGHLKDHTVGDKERSKGSIVELTVIVALDNFDGATKLYRDISEKNRQSDESVRFEPQRKSLHEM